MISRRPRKGFTTVEIMIVLILAVGLIAAGIYLLIYGAKALQRTSDNLAAQQAGRAAVARMVQEIQQCIEVITPLPGATMPYALVRDQVSCARWYYQRPQKGAPGLYELYRLVDDKTLAVEKRTELMMRGLKRLTFTSRSEGALQINMLFRENDADVPLLTTIRLRNIAAADEAW